ncbi:MAG TPA: pilin [Candidatus Saccharimonadales bacterium]|nr:pilin [Candidatus Saccharimonadales bacterium]
MFAAIQKPFARKFALLLTGLLLIAAMLAPFAGAADIDTNRQLCTGADLSFNSQSPAQGGVTAPCNIGDGQGQSAADRADSLIAEVINLITIVVGILAVIMIIYGGFRFVTSGGNPENTKAARNAILYALVGLVIVAFAQLIVKFVLGKVTGNA